jgi:hypothetical protein
MLTEQEFLKPGHWFAKKSLVFGVSICWVQGMQPFVQFIILCVEKIQKCLRRNAISTGRIA